MAYRIQQASITGYFFSCDQAALRTLLSVCQSVHLSVTPFSQCSCHSIIMKLSGVITIDRSDIHAKCEGELSKVKVTDIKTNFAPISVFPDCNSSLFIILLNNFPMFLPSVMPLLFKHFPLVPLPLYSLVIFPFSHWGGISLFLSILLNMFKQVYRSCGFSGLCEDFVWDVVWSRAFPYFKGSNGYF